VSIYFFLKKECSRDNICLPKEEITCENAISPEEYEDLAGLIDTEAFFRLPETIGCPDCADGGAEWLEIRNGSKVHKVTFEYMNEPEMLRDAAATLRVIIDDFEDCHQ
jgi:hypothetical protein